VAFTDTNLVIASLIKVVIENYAAGLGFLFAGRRDDCAVRPSPRIDFHAHVLARAGAQHKPGAVSHAAKIACRAGDGGATRKYDSLWRPLTLCGCRDKCDDKYKQKGQQSFRFH